MDKKAVIGALGALAQESRLDIFRLLVEAGPAGMGMTAIGDELGLPAISRAASHGMNLPDRPLIW